MESYIPFIGTLQNSGFWLVKVAKHKRTVKYTRMPLLNPTYGPLLRSSYWELAEMIAPSIVEVKKATGFC